MKWYQKTILFFCGVFCLAPVSVFAYDFAEDKCLSDNSCIVVCSYSYEYETMTLLKPNDLHQTKVEATKMATVYYFFADSKWKFVKDETLKSKYEYPVTKGPSSFADVFSTKGKNIFMYPTQTSSNFTCPSYFYLDDTGLSSEYCFDSDKKSCKNEHKKDAGTTFDEPFKKVYDSMDDIEKYFSEWSFGDMDCNAVMEMQDNTEQKIGEKLKTDFETNYLHGKKIPQFIENSSVYQNKVATILNAFIAKKNQCKQEIDQQEANGTISPEEAESQRNELDNIDLNKVESGINQAFSSMETDDLSHLQDSMDCETLFDLDEDGNFKDESLGAIIQKLLNYVRIAGPILVILFTMFEFAKAIINSDEDAMKKARSRLVIRLVAMLALFLLPFFVKEALKLINGISNPTCGFK